MTMAEAPNSDGKPAPLVRRLSTIMCADIAGYSQMMGANEERTVKIFRGHREIFESLVQAHRGRIFNTAGDALLAEFGSAVEAVRCATEIQAALRSRNAQLASEERMQFRIGINLGDVIVQGEDLLGDGVNVAARIQTATEPGGICISGSVYDQILNKLSLEFKLLGEQSYKNIARPVRTYTINEGVAVTARPSRLVAKTPLLVGTAAVLALAGVLFWGYQQFDAQRMERARVESQLAVQIAAQKQATEQAQRAAEDAKREAQLQAQKQAVEEAQRRTQDDRNRLEQDRKAIEAEKRAVADAAKKQLETAQRPIAPAAVTPAPVPTATKSGTQYDGGYTGQLCIVTPNNPTPECWALELVIRNGRIEGDWLGPMQKPSQARGTVTANGNLELSLFAWTRRGGAVNASLTGSVTADSASASGQWRGGSSSIVGNWKRGVAVAAAPTAKTAREILSAFNGNYSGQLCNLPSDRPPVCWPVVLVLRDGVAEAAWLSNLTKKTSNARGTVMPNGSIEIKVAGWTRTGDPTEALMYGRLVGDEISAAGRWRIGVAIEGNWKRTP